MAKYSPQDILRKFVLRNCIQHIVETSENAVWFNLTFWENVTNKAYASKCWDKLSKTFLRENPGFRLVGIWARQRRGAWHIHAVCNQRFDIEWLRSKAMRCGFGPRFHVQEIDQNPKSPEKIARYISNYCTDKNGLDKVKDKGVRRMIFVGKHVRVLDMRYKSSLKRVTSLGRDISESAIETERAGMTDFEKDFSYSEGRKKSWETWGDWYRRNRDYWFRVGWESMSEGERQEMLECDEFCRRYFESGRWSYV
jgi:hypothetical protein